MGIEIRLLGRFLALRDGEEIPASAFRQRLVRTLVRVLLSRRGEFVSRDVLTEALWPRRVPADPAANLRVLVTLARQALGDPSLLMTGAGGYAFSEDHRCLVDAEMFLARAADAQEALGAGDPREALRGFRSALQIWRGEPLPEDAYENWAHDYRRRLLGEHVQALEGAAAAALMVHMPGQALAWAEEAVGHDALRESSQLLFVEALAVRGKGGLRLTGQLGDVMKESAQAAMSYARAHGGDLGIPADFFETHDVHVHVPEGSIPKDVAPNATFPSPIPFKPRATASPSARSACF